MKNLKLIILLIFLIGADLTAEQPAWELVSMNPPRGLIYYFDTTGSGTIYFCHNKIFYSTNNGDNWIWTGDNNNGRMISINQYIIANKLINNTNAFVYRSSNNGETWVECNNLLNGSITFAKNNGLLYALVMNLKNYQYSFFSSSDYGNNWKYQGMIPDTITWSFVGLSAYKNIVITSGPALQTTGTNIKLSLDTGKTWQNIVFSDSKYLQVFINKPNEMIGTSDKGVFLSIDTCKTWTLKYLEGKTVTSFAISDDLKYLLASIGESGIYFSSDSGKTWEQSDEFKSTPHNINTSFVTFFQKGYAFCAPSYLSPFRSSDYGKTWEEISNGFSTMPPFDYIISPQNEMYISHLGIFKSVNQGNNFSFCGLRDICFGPLAYNSKGYIYAGMYNYNFTNNQGVYRSKDGGKTWDYHYVCYTGVTSLLVDKKDNIYASIGAGGLSRSTDDGETWTNNLVDGGGLLGMNDEGQVFSFINGHIYRTTDNGEKWNLLASISVDPTYIENGGRIIFNNKTSTAAYCGLLTLNNGHDWFSQVERDNVLSMSSSDCFAVDSSYNWIYAGSKILRSTDNGITWYRLDTTGLMHNNFTRVECSPDGHIYVFGNTGGLYRSRDRFVSVQEQLKPDNTTGSYSTSDYFEFYYTNRDYYTNKITIFNTLGEEVFRTSYSADDNPMGGTKQINISFLPEGVYFVRIGNRTEKFVRM